MLFKPDRCSHHVLSRDDEASRKDDGEHEAGGDPSISVRAITVTTRPLVVFVDKRLKGNPV